jgi:hypothetical protein
MKVAEEIRMSQRGRHPHAAKPLLHLIELNRMGILE